MGRRLEALLPSAEIFQCGGEIAVAVSQATFSGEMELGVGGFPEEEVAEALFVTGADQEINITRRGVAHFAETSSKDSRWMRVAL